MLPKLAVAVALDLRPFLQCLNIYSYSSRREGIKGRCVYTHIAVEIWAMSNPLSDALVETLSGAVVDASRRCGSRATEIVAARKRHTTETRILQYVHSASCENEEATIKEKEAYHPFPSTTTPSSTRGSNIPRRNSGRNMMRPNPCLDLPCPVLLPGPRARMERGNAMHVPT